MKRAGFGLVAALARVCAYQSAYVTGQVPAPNTQPGTRLSLDALKKEMFRPSAGRRIHPSVWPNGARVAAATLGDRVGE